jgi:hypothetical protein
MGWMPTHFAAATTAVANRFVTSVAMKVGAYTVANASMPTAGARKITVTHATVATGTDTLGTITVTGTNLAGATISEVITPLADQTVTGTKYFLTVTGVVGAGWVIAGGNDTITVGCAAAAVVAEGTGILHGVTISTTAAGAITIADATGTLVVLPSNAAVGQYIYDLQFTTFLSFTLAAASDITVEASYPSSAQNPASPYAGAAATRTLTWAPGTAYVDSTHMQRNSSYPDIFDKITT